MHFYIICSIYNLLESMDSELIDVEGQAYQPWIGRNLLGRWCGFQAEFVCSLMWETLFPSGLRKGVGSHRLDVGFGEGGRARRLQATVQGWRERVEDGKRQTKKMLNWQFSLASLNWPNPVYFLSWGLVTRRLSFSISTPMTVCLLTHKAYCLAPCLLEFSTKNILWL